MKMNSKYKQFAAVGGLVLILAAVGLFGAAVGLFGIAWLGTSDVRVNAEMASLECGKGNVGTVTSQGFSCH